MFPAQVTLDQEIRINNVAQLCQLFFRQVGNTALVRNTGLTAD